jgi:hypothetical protein
MNVKRILTGLASLVLAAGLAGGLAQLDPADPAGLRRVKKARLNDVRGKGRTSRSVFLGRDAAMLSPTTLRPNGLVTPMSRARRCSWRRPPSPRAAPAGGSLRGRSTPSSGR